MKKWFITILVVSLLSGALAYADDVLYHEVEENSPAYIDTGGYSNGDNQRYLTGYANSPYYDDRSNDVVWYYDKNGCKRYTTRAFANTYGVGQGRLRATDSYGYGAWNPGYSTVGKRFYPNSNYKREVKVKKKYGLLTSVLNFLI